MVARKLSGFRRFRNHYPRCLAAEEGSHPGEAPCPGSWPSTTQRASYGSPLARLGQEGGLKQPAQYPSPPLSVPAKMGGGPDGEYTIEGLMRYEAVRLFVDRAQLKLPDFELTQKNARAVARVCRKLDGIPLALELATARMGALAVEQVAQRLEASLDVLKGTSRTAAPRQQTLRATLDWSHNLLSE